MSRLNEEDHAELVAYLDGELDEEATQAFEARLSRDQKLRAEADALKKTWEMLDFLPRAEPSPSFTHRTMERLAVQTPSKSVAIAGQPGRWAWLAPVGWAAAMLIALIGGSFAAHQLWPQPTPPVQPPTPQQKDFDAQIAQDRDVILNKRILENGGDLGFARGLANMFDDEEGGS
jgi:anti-sigma factor RsiW